MRVGFTSAVVFALRFFSSVQGLSLSGLGHDNGQQVLQATLSPWTVVNTALEDEYRLACK